MVDDNIVAIDIIFCGGGNGATLGCIDFRTDTGGKIHTAMKCVIAGNGMHTISVSACQHGAVGHGKVESLACCGRITF